MADAFSCDPDQAQQLSEQLVNVRAQITSIQGIQAPQGQLGNGTNSIESAMTNMSNAVAATQQGLLQSVQASVNNFAGLAKGVTTLDQQQAGQV